MSAPDATVVSVPHGRDKTLLLRWRAIEGALEPMVRQVAAGLVASAPRFDHLERLRRLHRFAQSVPYCREPIETFQSPTLTLAQGGDCDCHVILLGALAWALRYPFAVDPIGDPMDPAHYSIWLGSPPAEDPDGGPETAWYQAESTVPAAFGESIESAARLNALETAFR